ncbi:ATP-dependent DNA helicase II subunit 1 [Batrachochytrium dendrobatidis]|nr:ATP-dependent DNA helicase II subunit 1 [Batrachochytrium dendrobatidis]
MATGSPSDRSLTATTSIPNWRVLPYESDDDDTNEYFSGLGETKERLQDKYCDLFLVDAAFQMHQVPDGQSISPFNTALSSIAAYLQTKVFESNSDTIGLVFYGTNTTQNAMHAKSIYVKYDLDLPDINRILELKHMAKDSSVFESQIGSATDPYNYSDVYWVALSIFSKSAPRLARKRIFVITNQDLPTSTDALSLAATRSRISELESMYISVELFAIDKSDTDFFALNLFYNQIPEFWLGDDVDLTTIPSSDNFSELCNRILLKKFKQSIVFRVPFTLTGGFRIGVKGTYLVKAKNGQSVKHLEHSTMKQVDFQSILTCMTTGQLMIPDDLKLCYSFETEKVVFTNEEKCNIKSFGEPQLVLVGFMDVSDLKAKHNLQASVFITPDEKQYSGSSSLFSHLLKQMSNRNKLAICKLIARVNSVPRMIALLPQIQGVGFFGKELLSGFHGIYLPFGDDLRVRKYAPRFVPPELVDAASELLNHASNATIDFSLFNNPVIDRHNAYVEALALGQDCPRETLDATMPDEQEIHDTYGDFIQNFKSVCQVYNSQCNDNEPTTGIDIAKRTVTSTGSKQAKRSKLASKPMDVQNVEILASQGKLSTLSVLQLNQFLTTVKWDITSNRKADLISQVMTYLQSI